MSDISFRKCFELFEKFGRAGSSLRTFAACLVSRMDGYSPKLSHSWKAKVSRSLRFVFLLQPSARRTDVIGSGLLRTPKASDEKNRKNGANDRKDGFPHLMSQVETFGAQAGSTLRLEPAFVEWMMGYPLNWTSLEAENEDWPQMGAGTDGEMLPTPTTQEVEHPKAELTKTGRRRTGKSSHSLNLADTLTSAIVSEAATTEPQD